MAAPSEAKALEALKVVQALSGAQLQQRIDREVGNSMLGILDSLAKAVFPDAKTEQQHQIVHLLVLSYLMRGEAEKK